MSSEQAVLVDALEATDRGVVDSLSSTILNN